MSALAIRAGTRDDLPGIFAIYDEVVRTSLATFDLEPKTPAQREAWYDARFADGRHPLYVAEAAGAIQGYAYRVPYREKPAYARTHEATIYLAPQARGQGLGRRLYDALIADARAAGLHVLFAGISGENPASEALHRACGFVRRGVLPELGHKFGAWVDVQVWTLTLEEEPA